MGAAIDIEYDGFWDLAQTELIDFHRSRDEIRTPMMMKLEPMLNNFRIFSVESFLIIPQSDLRDIFGRYYEDRLIITMILMEMIEYPR